MQLLKRIIFATTLLFSVSNQANATLFTWHLEFVVDSVSVDYNYPRDSYPVPDQGDILDAVISYDTDTQLAYGHDSLSVYTDDIAVNIPELTTDVWGSSQSTELRNATGNVAIESREGGYFGEKLEIYFSDHTTNLEPPTNWHTTFSQINFVYRHFLETLDTPPWRDAQLLVSGHARSVTLLTPSDSASVPESSSIAFLLIALFTLLGSSRLNKRA
ncbi:hypothetical protein [Thalassomonas haliotis]|uniref:PEP-CTERM protein-sorting domain-containing protein n=1 Tax=Thalassomonas haliotis TaxID=485448 RepID=A0ABY7VAG5_9GAMM|nr:hypothetical protein [Thalassomonas haliotis]WDE10610.1 hypothetical protein H3N35_20470 [Thalassomonas haliotis]